jgi:hypothetical protein
MVHDFTVCARCFLRLGWKKYFKIKTAALGAQPFCFQHRGFNGMDYKSPTKEVCFSVTSLLPSSSMNLTSESCCCRFDQPMRAYVLHWKNAFLMASCVYFLLRRNGHKFCADQ